MPEYSPLASKMMKKKTGVCVCARTESVCAVIFLTFSYIYGTRIADSTSCSYFPTPIESKPITIA
jgi:hypothetical protein